MVSPLLPPIVIAAAGAAITWMFQNHSARLVHERNKREAELRRAEEIFKEVSTCLDAVYYYLRHAALHVAVRQAKQDTSLEQEDLQTWQAYNQALLEWMTNKTRFAEQVKRYFGERLDHIDEVFDEAKSLVAATYYDRTRSVVKNGVEDSGAYYEKIDALEEDLRALSGKMIDAIQGQNVGQLRQQVGNQTPPRHEEG